MQLCSSSSASAGTVLGAEVLLGKVLLGLGKFLSCWPAELSPRAWKQRKERKSDLPRVVGENLPGLSTRQPQFLPLSCGQCIIHRRKSCVLSSPCHSVLSQSRFAQSHFGSVSPSPVLCLPVFSFPVLPPLTLPMPNWAFLLHYPFSYMVQPDLSSFFLCPGLGRVFLCLLFFLNCGEHRFEPWVRALLQSAPGEDKEVQGSTPGKKSSV